MKTIVSIMVSGLILFGALACDKVKNPIISKQTAVGTTFDSVSNASVANFKKVLLEDYTGHKCGNCPAAAIVAQNLSNQYKDTLVVIAVHAGFFAKTNTEFPTSYTTQAGNDWDGSSGFNVGALGNPNGMVNRKIYPGFALIHKETNWPSTVNLGKKDEFSVRVDLVSKYDYSARALNVSTKLTFLKSFTNNIKLNLVLIEDSIIGPQLDYTQTPDVVEHYHFEHMLRGAINSSWGEVAKSAPIAANTTTTVTNNNFLVEAKLNDKKLYLVAIVFDEVTKEVLQVEKVKIRK